MAYSKFSVVIVEGDSHVSRVLRTHFEESFDQLRVEIAGSAAKAGTICEKFPPSCIIWDGNANAHGSEADYLNAIPDAQWGRVIPICIEPALQEKARQKGALPCIPKRADALKAWSGEVVEAARKLMAPSKKK